MKKRKMQLPPAIPITLGIVGHRDAIITENHRQAITDLFSQLHEAYPNSPLYLFSQLAEGADCDVADMFMEAKGDRDALIAPLPFETDAYKKTFGDKAHLNRFKELAEKATRQFELAGVPKDENEQNQFFRDGGKFVADSSVILIVLWDGVVNNLVGGAADIVQYKKKGSFTDDDYRNIYEKPAEILDIRCNRAKNPPKDVPEIITPLLTEILKDKNIAKALQKIEELNNEGTGLDDDGITGSLKYLISETAALGKEDLVLAAYYCLTDCLALSNQTHYYRSLKTLFFTGFLIVGVFECYKHYFKGPNSLLGAIVLIVFAIGLSAYARKKEFHMRFLEARVLAESLRVQFFWNLVGLQKNAGDHILRIYKREYDWIKYILNGVYGITFPDAKTWHFTEVKKEWVNGQLNYFNTSILSVAARRKLMNSISVAAFYLALLTLAFMYIFHHCLKQADLLDYLIIASGVLLAVFGLLKAYIEKRGYAQILNQRILMRDVFQATLSRIDSVKDDPGHKIKKELLHQAGVEALIENGNWYLIYKDKEPSVEGMGG